MVTVAVWTQKTFFPLLIRPQGSQGCQKMHQDPLNVPFEVWCANIAPKLKNIRKCLRKQLFFDIFFPILTVFRSLCLSGVILAHQTSNGMFSGSWRIFWHPWDPWVRVNSRDISFLIFVFDFSVWQSHLADFFHNSQIEARCHLYWFCLLYTSPSPRD